MFINKYLDKDIYIYIYLLVGEERSLSWKTQPNLENQITLNRTVSVVPRWNIHCQLYTNSSCNLDNIWVDMVYPNTLMWLHGYNQITCSLSYTCARTHTLAFTHLASIILWITGFRKKNCNNLALKFLKNIIFSIHIDYIYFAYNTWKNWKKICYCTWLKFVPSTYRTHTCMLYCVLYVYVSA